MTVRAAYPSLIYSMRLISVLINFVWIVRDVTPDCLAKWYIHG
ncbi:hypothetical protein [Kaarinaea lacus]